MAFGKALVAAAEEAGANVDLLIIPETGMHGKEPSKTVAAAMKASDVFVCPTTYSLSHTNARKNACKAGARCATMPGITKAMFTGALTADYKKVAKLVDKMSDVLDKSKTVHITSPSGTDITFSIKGRTCDRDNGIYTKKGAFGNLPAGEACMAPVEGTANGVFVIDTLGKVITKPTPVVFKKGFAVKFGGTQGKKLKKMFDAAKTKKAFALAELGVGANAKAKLSGFVLEDEKVMGTVHLALGNNTSYPGGKNYAPIHEDGIMLKPTMKVDGKVIIKNGKWLI